MALDYNKLANATVQDLSNPDVLKAFNRPYASPNSVDYFTQNFAREKANLLNGFNLSNEDQKLADAFSNFNNPNNPTDTAAAAKVRQQLIDKLNYSVQDYANFGIDYTTTPAYQAALKTIGGIGATPGAGARTSQQAAQQQAQDLAIHNAALGAAPGGTPNPNPAGQGLQMPTGAGASSVFDPGTGQQTVTPGTPPSGLNFEQGAAANKANPPTYGEQGQQTGGAGFTPPTPAVSGATTGATAATEPTSPTAPNTAVQSALDTHGVIPFDPNEDPIKYTQDVYNKISGNLGLPNLKSQIDDYNKQLLDFRNDIVDKKQAINDNPWLTEGIRQKQLNSLDEKSAQKEANLIAYLNLSQSLYQQGTQQAQFLSNAAIGLHQDQVNFAQQQILNSQAEATKQADARFQLANGQPFYKNPGSDLVYSTATGKGLSYEQYIAQGGDPKFANVTTLQPNQTQEQTLVADLIGKDPGAGILPTDSLATAEAKYKAGAVYRKDTYIAPIGGASGVDYTPSLLSSRGDDGFVDPGVFLKQRSTAGISADQFNAKYGYLLSPQEQKNLGIGTRATDAQNSAAGYADRLVQANTTLNSLQDTIANYSATGFYTQKDLPANLQSSNIQQYQQASLNFINSVLRRESGAAISQGEYDTAYKQYLPLPGDSKETLALKAQNRATQIANLQRDAGPAASIQGQVISQGTTSSGLNYTVTK